METSRSDSGAQQEIVHDTDFVTAVTKNPLRYLWLFQGMEFIILPVSSYSCLIHDIEMYFCCIQYEYNDVHNNVFSLSDVVYSIGLRFFVW